MAVDYCKEFQCLPEWWVLIWDLNPNTLSSLPHHKADKLFHQMVPIITDEKKGFHIWPYIHTNTRKLMKSEGRNGNRFKNDHLHLSSICISGNNFCLKYIIFCKGVRCLVSKLSHALLLLLWTREFQMPFSLYIVHYIRLHSTVVKTAIVNSKTKASWDLVRT